MAKARTGTARAGLTPQRLVQAGAELADEVGFAQVTLAELARRFDVRVASLYSHLRSTGDLKARIAGLALTELADRATDAVAGRAGREALLALAEVHRDYALRHPGRSAATRHPLDPATDDAATTAAAEAAARHARMTRALLRGYALPEPAETHAVRLLGSVFHGFTDLEAAGAFSRSEPEPKISWEWALDALDTLLSGLGKPV